MDLETDHRDHPEVNSSSTHGEMFIPGITFGVLLVLLVPLGIAMVLRGGVMEPASWILPAAMGFLLVLSCGAIDLSVWVVMGVGGAVAAGLINRGVAPGVAFPAAVVLGAAIGAINGLLVARVRLPSILVTTVVGLAMMGGMWALNPPRMMEIPNQTFDAWISVLNDGYIALVNALLWISGEAPLDDVRMSAPLTMLRMLLVSGAWSAVLVVLLAGNRRRPGRGSPPRRWVLFASLCASGALSSLGGICWLLDQGQTPIPTRLVDSLVIPVAVVLAGGIVLRDRGRTVLAGIFLPLALLLISLWRELILPARVWGYSLQLLLLGVIVLEVQWAFCRCLTHPRPKHWWGWFPAVLSAGGLGVLGCSALVDFPHQPTVQSIGVVLWALGAIPLLIQSAPHILRNRRGVKQSSDL